MSGDSDSEASTRLTRRANAQNTQEPSPFWSLIVRDKNPIRIAGFAGPTCALITRGNPDIHESIISTSTDLHDLMRTRACLFHEQRANLNSEATNGAKSQSRITSG